MIQFTIPGQLPGLNEYTKACRANRYVGAKLKEETETMIGWQIRRQIKVPIHTAVKIHFHWVEPSRRRDMDNIAFAKKFILDALQSAGILRGDGWAQIGGLSDTFAVDKREPRVEITIEAA